MRLKESLYHVLEQEQVEWTECNVPEALSAVQDIQVTLTSLLVAKSNIVSLVEKVRLMVLQEIFRCRKDISSLLA